MAESNVIEAWPAQRLTDLAVEWLRAHYPGALIIPEFVCGAMGSARVDVAAVMPDAIHGVEVKGDGDTAARLASQGPLFSAVCSTMHLIWTPNKPDFNQKCPPYWGRLHIHEGAVTSTFYAGGRHALLSPYQLLNTLWRKELKRLCVRLRVSHDPKKSTVGQMISDIAENIPLHEIRAGVCTILRERDWTQPTMNGGEPRRIIQQATDLAGAEGTGGNADG